MQQANVPPTHISCSTLAQKKQGRDVALSGRIHISQWLVRVGTKTNQKIRSSTFWHNSVFFPPLQTAAGSTLLRKLWPNLSISCSSISSLKNRSPRHLLKTKSDPLSRGKKSSLYQLRTKDWDSEMGSRTLCCRLNTCLRQCQGNIEQYGNSADVHLHAKMCELYV